jgi:hypothetical protein
VDLSDIGFKIAFGVLQYKTEETLHDPNFVKFEVALVDKNFASAVKTILKFHACTPEDYDGFYNPSLKS